MITACEVRRYRVAADQGDAGAQQSLGLAYYLGDGVKQDWSEAAKWYRLAADQGLARAQFFLGIMYAEGLGVPQDFVAAHMWFNLSAVQDGDHFALDSRDKVAQLMTPEQIAEAQKWARDWRQKPAR